MNLKNQENKIINNNIFFNVRKDGTWAKVSTKDIFSNKKIVLFGLPGAFTPTCSSSHLPRYEFLYDVFKKIGVDEIYCMSVNDTFVMNEWANYQEIKNIKMLPDGNAELTSHLEMLVNKSNLGFGQRSWRFSMYIDNGKIIKHFIEPDKEGDPFEVSDADTMIKYLNATIEIPINVTIFTKNGCPFCKEAKELLKLKGYKFSEVELSDAVRQNVLSGLSGKIQNTVPYIYFNGKLIGGLDELKNHLENI